MKLRLRRLTPAAAALLAALALAACAGEPRPAREAGPPVTAEAAVDRPTATTGDVVTYTVSVEHDPALAVEIPDAGAEIGGLAVLDAGREGPRTVAGRVAERRWVRLRADLVGSYTLPAVEVAYRPASGADGTPAEAGDGSARRGSVATSPVLVEVASVLPADGSATDIRDVKPLRRLDGGPPWRWIAAAGVVLALAAAGLALARRRRQRPAALPPAPHEVALQALHALGGTDFEDPEAVRRYHFQVSEVVRAYVEGRFRLNATDLTTEEILPQLSTLALAPAEAGRLARLLGDTDRVKFAARRPSRQEIGRTHRRAVAFVEATRPASEVPAAAEVREAAA